ncbi:hypothetical protein SFRURICE_015733 [Spodoptera frugiperda]|nr:hypothetical protein SFRURICE_015733 [Spodoptera frugiperda]
MHDGVIMTRHVPKAKHTTMAETPELKRIAENTKIQSNVKYHADFEKSKGIHTDDPETLRIKANTKIISNVAYHGELEKKAQMEKQRQINENGEIVDVPSDNYHQQIDNYATEMLPPNSPPPNLPPKNHYQTPGHPLHLSIIARTMASETRQIGRVTDLDPLANEMPRPPTNHHNQRVYVAMYDYEASDSDEVSFREGDLISNVTSIDSGWMTGQVLRTGRTGMLPANYVELTTPNAGPHYDN